MNVQSLLVQQLLKNGIGLGGVQSSLEETGAQGEFAELLQQLGGASVAPARVIPAEIALQALANRAPLSAYLEQLPGTAEWNLSASSNRDTYQPLISNASAQYGVDESLIQAVIQAESDYNPNAVSHAGAKGLMQLMDQTAQGLGVADSFDPVQNVDGGTKFLSGLLRKYDGNVGVALAAYNAGPGRIDRLGISTDAELMQRLGELPQETQGYVTKVLGLRAAYESENIE